MEFEMKLVAIVRFAVILASLIFGIAVTLRSDDNGALRRVSCILSAVLIYFNVEIGEWGYLTLGAAIETALTVMGVGFTLILGAVLMLLPLIFTIRYLTH